MIQQILIELFERDLSALSNEIKSYQDETNLWKIEAKISNSGGNLCLHLIGNLNHFIGYTLGNSQYIRQRDLEFSQKDIPVSTLLKMIEETKSVVSETIKNLTEKELESEFPLRVFNRSHTNLHFILHLSTHLNYHLGQINYHRRLLDRA